MCLSFSAILVPQLMEEQLQANGTGDYIAIDKESASWVASVFSTITIPSALIAAIVIDVTGRINLIRIATIPMVLGWALIAIAQDMPTICIGRLLTGLPYPWATSSSAAYITEVSSPRLRGALVSFNSLCISIGMLICYTEGSIIHWRTVAWICIFFSVLPAVLLICVPESSSYLLMKGRPEAALKSLKWIHSFQNPLYVEKQFLQQQQQIEQKRLLNAQATGNKYTRALKKFTKPTCYKPMLIIFGEFFFQHFTGIFITFFYAVLFLKDTGTTIDPYVASIYVGAARVVMSLICIWLFKLFKRRHMLLISTAGMCISMAISGLFTDLIKRGETTQKWVPLVMIVNYVVFSMIGLLALPFIFSAELFGLEVRGVGQSVCLGFANAMMFIALKSYFRLMEICGGVAGLQYFFSVMSLFAFIYGYMFVPESHQKSLVEIEEYFMTNTLYISMPCKKKSEERT